MSQRSRCSWIRKNRLSRNFSAPSPVRSTPGIPKGVYFHHFHHPGSKPRQRWLHRRRQRQPAVLPTRFSLDYKFRTSWDFLQACHCQPSPEQSIPKPSRSPTCWSCRPRSLVVRILILFAYLWAEHSQPNRAELRKLPSSNSPVLPCKNAGTSSNSAGAPRKSSSTSHRSAGGGKTKTSCVVVVVVVVWERPGPYFPYRPTPKALPAARCRFSRSISGK